MTSVGHNILVMSTFHSLIRHHDECRMQSRKCLPFCHCVSLFHVIVLDFEFWLLGIFIFYFYTRNIHFNMSRAYWKKKLSTMELALHVKQFLSAMYSVNTVHCNLLNTHDVSPGHMSLRRKYQNIKSTSCTAWCQKWVKLRDFQCIFPSKQIAFGEKFEKYNFQSFNIYKVIEIVFSNIDKVRNT